MNFPTRCHVIGCDWTRKQAANIHRMDMCKARLSLALNVTSAADASACLSIRRIDFVESRVREARSRALSEWIGEATT